MENGKWEWEMEGKWKGNGSKDYKSVLKVDEKKILSGVEGGVMQGT